MGTTGEMYAYTVSHTCINKHGGKLVHYQLASLFIILMDVNGVCGRWCRIPTLLTYILTLFHTPVKWSQKVYRVDLYATLCAEHATSRPLLLPSEMM